MFEIKEKFYLNDKPFQIISGSFHYFRTVPEYWRDRMEKLKNMGCNTVETYIPWNFHEPDRGRFLWDGRRNILKFIEIAKELGLYMIIRPSPYICSEWDLGGLPAWLLRDGNMRLRCSCKPYLDAVDNYYSVLMPNLVPYQIDKGGNIILMQIENEYGYYGNDTAYLQFLADTMRKYGITVPFVTSDGPWNAETFSAGQLPEALPTGNFGSDMKKQFDTIQGYIGDRPLMCMEYWAGWYDAWGEKHHTSDLEQNKADLDEVMRRGSINFYMFAGGTTFGFMNGCNEGAKTPQVTSYDFDAPLTEDGRITEKYLVLRSVIEKYREVPQIPLTTEIRRREYGKIAVSRKTDLFCTLEKISEPISSPYPVSMEEVGQNYGYILYRTRLSDNEAVREVRLEGASDRVWGFMNGSRIFTAYGENLWNKFEIKCDEKGARCDFLVENCGRVNFGGTIETQRKGISRAVRINDLRRYGFEIFRLPLNEEQIAGIDFDSGYSEGVPAFYEFRFNADESADTFLELDGFGKGCAFINGFNLGRFWEIGPQRRLYIPAPLIGSGENTIVIFETEGKAVDTIFLAGEPKLDTAP